MPGVLAVVLFGAMAMIVLNTQFGPMTDGGFPTGVSITSELGYAMFDLTELQSTEGALGNTEPFLAAFLLIAVVLDAALDAALVLAKREEKGEPVSALGSRGTADESADRTAVADGGDAAGSTAHSSDTDGAGGESR